MDVNGLRREVIARLIERRFSGRQVDFAKAIKVAPSTVTRWLKGSKNIGERKARELEDIPALSLAPGELLDPKPSERRGHAEESAVHYELTPHPSAPAGLSSALLGQLERDLPLLAPEDRSAIVALVHERAEAERRRRSIEEDFGRLKKPRSPTARSFTHGGSEGKPSSPAGIDKSRRGRGRE